LGNVLSQCRKVTGSHLTPWSQLTVERQRVQWRGNWVEIDLEEDDHDHLISPEERFRIAMAALEGASDRAWRVE
jgi:hypothetical protein